MSNYSRSVAMAGTALVSAGTLVLTTPVIAANAATAPALGVAAASPVVALLSHDHGNGYGYGKSDDDDDGYGSGHGYGYNDDEDDDDRGWGGFGGVGSFITDFLADNQTEVLAVTAMIPTIYLGPVAVGNSLLANAYYSGYEGSATGVEGVIAYVTSQFGVPQTDLVQTAVLGLTSLVPQFNIGPVAVGNALLATAYFSGYNGSATGLPGVISYVTDQLGLQSAPVAAAGSVAAPADVTESGPAQVSESRSASAALDRAAGATPDAAIAAVADADEVVTTKVSTVDADAPEAAVPAASRSKVGSANAARPTGRGPSADEAISASGQSKSRSARSASGRSGAGQR